MTILFLTLLGVQSQHQITSFSFDAKSQTLTYTEAGIQHSQPGIAVFSYSVVAGVPTLIAKTDEIFKNGFES